MHSIDLDQFITLCSFKRR